MRLLLTQARHQVVDQTRKGRDQVAAQADRGLVITVGMWVPTWKLEMISMSRTMFTANLTDEISSGTFSHDIHSTFLVCKVFVFLIYMKKVSFYSFIM